MPGATIGTYNCLFRNDPDVVTGDVQQLAVLASVLVLTEARSKGVDRALRGLGWSEFRHPKDSSDRITWNPDLWAVTHIFGAERVHDAGPSKYLPAREVTWQALRHKASGTTHLFMASHVTAGYASEDPPFQAWRDKAAQDHLLTIVARTARLCLHPELDYHHLAGDLNAHRVRRSEWWYPVRILDSLYAPDDKVGGLDYVMHTRLSEDRGLTVAARWTLSEGLASDHEAHLKRVRFPRH